MYTVFEKSKLAAALCALLLAGCCNTGPKPPSAEERAARTVALADVLKSLRVALQETAPQPGERPLGLAASDVSITLAVTNLNENTKTIGVDFSIAPIIKEIPSASFDSTSKNSLTSVNTVVINFKNVLFAPKETVLGAAANAGAPGASERFKEIVQGVAGSIQISGGPPRGPNK